MKKLYLIISMLLVVTAGGCGSHTNVITTAVTQIEDSKHIEQLHDYNSPYTICYKNKDGTYSMFIFASPIQYETDTGYEVIDNTIINSSDANYAFENKANCIKTYFPSSLTKSFKVENSDVYLEFTVKEDVTGFSEAKQKMFSNMYGDTVSAVVYERSDMNIVFYPTKAGIKVEFILKQKPKDNKFSFNVTTNGTTYQNKHNGYVLFKNGDQNVGLVYAPLIKGSMGKYNETSGNFSIDSDIDLEYGESEGYVVSVRINQDMLNNESIYPIRFDPSFELYLNKQPDSGIYSKTPTTNSYLKAVSVIGNSDTLGIGRQYLRFRFNYVLACDKSSIISSYYYIKELSGFISNDKMSLNKMNEQWSSTGLTWSSRIQYGENIKDKFVKKSGTIAFDIKEYTQDCFTDLKGKTESYGLILSGSEEINKYKVFASSDNSEYSPYVEIKLNKLPNRFTCRTNINPSN